MEKSIAKPSPEKGSTSSDVSTILRHGEKSPPSDVSPAKSPENTEKKVLTKEVKIPSAPAHFESLGTDAVSQDDKEEEEINLRLQSSDEEIFEDTVEDVSELIENETSAVEKYFSDIESSDNSQVYEPKTKGGTSVEAKKAVSKVCEVIDTKELNKEKSELDFEPVESEEDFEESRSQEEAPLVLQMEEDSSEIETQSQVKEESNGTLEAEIDALLSSDKEASENEANKESTSSADVLLENEKKAPKECLQETPSVLKSVDGKSDDIPETTIPDIPPGSPTKSQESMEANDSLAPLEKNEILAEEREPSQEDTYISEEKENKDDDAMEVGTDLPSIDVKDNVSVEDYESPSESINEGVESREAIEVGSGEADSNKKHIAVGDGEKSQTQTSNQPIGKTREPLNEEKPSELQETVEQSTDALEVFNEEELNAPEDNKSVSSPTQSSTSFENVDISVDVDVPTETSIESSKAAEKSEACADPTESETSREPPITPSNEAVKSEATAEISVSPYNAGEKSETSTGHSTEKILETSTKSLEMQEKSHVTAEVIEKSQRHQQHLTGGQESLNAVEKITNAAVTSANDESKKEDSIEDETYLQTSTKSLETQQNSQVSVVVVEKSQENQQHITGAQESLNAVEKITNAALTSANDESKKEDSIEDETYLQTSTKSLETEQKSQVSVVVVEKSQENQQHITGAQESLNAVEKITNAALTSANDESKKEDSIEDETYLKNSQLTLETAKNSMQMDEECEDVLTQTEKSKLIAEEQENSLGESVVTVENFLDEIESAEKSLEAVKSPEREQIKEHSSSDILMDTTGNSPKVIDACANDSTVDELPNKPEKSMATEDEEFDKAQKHISESAKAPELAQNLEGNVNDSAEAETSEKTDERKTESEKTLESAQKLGGILEDSSKADNPKQLNEEEPLGKSAVESEKSDELSEKPKETDSSEKPLKCDGEVSKGAVSFSIGNSAQNAAAAKVSQPEDEADIKEIVVTDDSNLSREENAAKQPISIDPEIIEIDDDALEDNKIKDHTTASDTQPEQIEGKEDDAPPEVNSKQVVADKLELEQDKPLSEVTVPIEKITEKGEGSTEKPSNACEAEKVIESAVPEDIEMLENIDKDKIGDLKQPNGDEAMKPPETASAQAPPDDDDSLLMIDTSHKEDNEPDDNDMDTETEQTATSAPTTTDSSSEGSLEIFYDKECVHYECKHGSKNFYRATLFTLNYYKISRKRNKAQYVCEECYDRALSSYEEMCKTLTKKQPLLHGATFKGQEFVEIIDSSEEDDDEAAGDNFKDENALPKDSIELLEAELEGAIRKVMHNVDIQNQLSWTKQILQQRLNNLQEDTEFVSVQLRQLQKKADNMHNSLYQCPKIKIRQLTPLDLNSGRTYNPETESTIPPMGEVLRTSIHVNETYYAVKNKAIASWVPCKVIEAVESYSPYSKSQKHFKIKFLKSKYPMLKTVSAKHMAFFNPPNVRLPIGTRVIAFFDVTSLSRGKEKMLIPSAFYPGIIAEPLKQSNKFRYLVFYDDGYFQYVYHKDVRLVCQASENVWEDVHHQSREFIHNYLTQYAVNRPMVQTQKGQSMLVDYNGKWIYARVIDVDCSLVQMLFEGQSRSEWIYRGSTRLGPVYKESNSLVQKNQTNTSRISRRTEPFIRYINGDDSSSSQQSQEQPPQQSQPKTGEVRSVAKKSVSKTDNSHQSSQQVPTVRHLNNSTIFVDDDNKPKGKVVYYTARKNLPPRDYVPHICSPTCPFNVTHNLSFYSPLAKPLLSGWERQVFRQKSKKFIVYRGPCGKRLRSMEELHRYLRVTENDLNVDNFDFSAETNCLAEYVIESCIVQKKDISNGKEKMPIPCVNYYDNTMPPDCIYSSRRIPTEGVPLNLNKDFLVGCDCEDDCSDKSKCSCWELTYAGAKYGMPNVPNEMVGYQYKRLYEHVPTGIYECNARCKCKANCVNRVVQQPLQSKLQVFKTSNRGWGLRCINDVPRGSFICIYAGHLLNEQKANEGGLDAGDEYFAELDYIEVAEQIKEGYESDVVEPDEDEDLYNPDKEDEDDDEFVAPDESHRNRSFNTRSRSRRSTKNSSDVEHDSQERQVISFEPNKTMGQPDNSTSEKPTIRKLFGKDEACYIMDAKITGNLGRYFNHSCSPNLFVQNVFVDTHDLRFPWVAFFAFTHIRAGTELTWNYNYEVGVVPGKVLYCQCGAPNCRQRLL